MDMAQVDRMTEWVRSNAGERTGTAELLERADGSDLPQEVKRVMRELPDTEWGRDELLAELRRIAEERFGAGAGTTMAGRQGGGGVFGE